jgi:ATP-binding cassette subfamily C protein LapB
MNEANHRTNEYTANQASINERVTLNWLIQRLVQINRSGIVDRLQLHSALETDVVIIKGEPLWQSKLNTVSQALGWGMCELYTDIDAARLPLVGYNSQLSWFIILAKKSQNVWTIESNKGQANVSEKEIALPLFRLKPDIQKPKNKLAFSVIWRLFMTQKTLIIEGVCATILINLIALGTSFFSMQVYDRVIPSQGYSTLYLLTIGVMLAIIFEFILKYTRSRIMDHAVVNIDTGISRDIFARLLQVRLDQMPHSVGSLAGQLRSYEGIRSLLTASTAYILVDVPFALLFIILMGLLGTVYLMIVPVVALILSLIAGFILKSSITHLALSGAKVGNEKTGLLVEAVEGAETIKAGQGGWRFLSRWIDINHQSIYYDLKIRHSSELSGYITATLQQICYASLVAVGAWQVMEGHMTMGALIACSILSGRALGPVGMIPGLLVQYAHAKAALNGLERVYALENDNEGIDQPLVPSIIKGQYQLESVRYTYTTASSMNMALYIPKLTIEAGEKIAILGPIGSGKSTLLRLLSGLYQPREGRILLDGLEMSHIARQCIAENVGYLQQEHRLFLGTLRDNLLIGLLDPGDEAIIQAAKTTGLIGLISRHPKGLDLPINEGGKGLSGGQKQLVAFTRIVLTRPNIWLLDEPTASMDEDSERCCLNILKQQFTPNITAVIVTHKPSILPLVDRIIVVSQQTIVLDGSRDEVLKRLSAVS